MIDELHVQNLALIEDAVIQPSNGLTVLTGETGAGKSALLSAIKLLMGERADAGQVRDGVPSLQVEARVFTASDAKEYPDGHVASRKVSAEGRSRCTLDGSMATVGQLAQVIGSTVDLCGQHDHQRLLSSTQHLPLLDAWAAEAVRGALETYEGAWKHCLEARREFDRVRAACSEGAAQVEDARYVIGRIGAVAPVEGEFEDLERKLPRMEHAEALAQGADGAYRAIGDEDGALDALNAALAALESVERFDPDVSALAAALREAIYPVEDVAARLRRYRDDVDFDPEELAHANERMGELNGLVRAYGPTMSEVFERLRAAQDLVSLVDDSQAALGRVQRRLDEAERELAGAAAALTQARKVAAPEFSAAVSAQMARLEMGSAELVVAVEPLPRSQWGPRGADAAEFLYRPAATLQPRPLAKIASGGELSRVMLSIKVVLGAHDDVETLIFDEIDAGVGGSVARAVAAVIADLAKERQVIVVTHLAQLAVVAQTHYVVSKGTRGEGGVPRTTLRPVTGEERVREVARLLSGDEDVATMEHARALLDKAGVI